MCREFLNLICVVFGRSIAVQSAINLIRVVRYPRSGHEVANFTLEFVGHSRIAVTAGRIGSESSDHAISKHNLD